MVIALILSFAAIIITTTTHYQALRLTAGNFITGRTSAVRLIIIVVFAFIAHLIEIVVYAVIYKLMTSVAGLGHLAGEFNNRFIEFIYYSAVNYTTLGLGDIWPHGPIRCVTTIEAINGLFLIGWSVTFTYPILQSSCQTMHNYKKSSSGE